jgi:hypothetical protein
MDRSVSAGWLRGVGQRLVLGASAAASCRPLARRRVSLIGLRITEAEVGATSIT